MDDLISRQAVKELAHKQMREKYCGTALKKERDFYIKLADSIIDLLPSAEPQIIRCKDCAKEHWCKFTQYQYQGENGFCSLAERRTDG